MLEDPSMDGLLYWLPYAKSASGTSSELRIHVIIIIACMFDEFHFSSASFKNYLNTFLALGSSLEMATVISSTMLLCSFIYALAMRKKHMREIAPIAFKKHRHVPDFSVILRQWLNCHRLDEKCVTVKMIYILQKFIYFKNFQDGA
jgi:hypothetical protein